MTIKQALCAGTALGIAMLAAGAPIALTVASIASGSSSSSETSRGTPYWTAVVPTSKRLAASAKPSTGGLANTLDDSAVIAVAYPPLTCEAMTSSRWPRPPTRAACRARARSRPRPPRSRSTAAAARGPGPARCAWRRRDSCRPRARRWSPGRARDRARRRRCSAEPRGRRSLRPPTSSPRSSAPLLLPGTPGGR